MVYMLYGQRACNSIESGVQQKHENENKSGSNDDKTNISDNEHSTDEGDGKSTYNLNIWPAMGVASSMALPPPGIVDCS